MYGTNPSAAPASDTPPPMIAAKSSLAHDEEKKLNLRWAPQMQNKNTKRKKKKGGGKHGYRRRARDFCENVLGEPEVIFVIVTGVGTTGRRFHHNSALTDIGIPVENVGVCVNIGIPVDIVVIVKERTLSRGTRTGAVV